MQFKKVYTRSTSKRPAVETEYESAIIPGKCIAIRRVDNTASTKPTVFHIGDMAEYDSYNLSYIGVIESITNKTITIKPAHNERKRLDLYTFAWRNYNFDLEKVRANNAETMMYI